MKNPPEGSVRPVQEARATLIAIDPHRKLDRDKLLAALAELPQERSEALAVLPWVLSQNGEGHATVTIRHPDGSLRLAASNDRRLEPGLEVPKDGIVGLAAEERRTVYVTDAFSHPRYRVLTAEAYPVELALPIFERDQVVAVLNVERATAYTPQELGALEVFAGGVSRQLTLVSHGLEARITAELYARVAEGTSLAEAASTALDVIVPAIGASSGVVMGEHRESMVRVADRGLEDLALRAHLDAGMPYPSGFAWGACLRGEPLFARDHRADPRGPGDLGGCVGPTVLALPVGRNGVNRFALCLHFEEGAHVSAADISLLRSVCQQLAAVFESAKAAALQGCLLDLYTRALESDTQGLYQQVLDAAIRHVPGAEAGSLLVRRGEWDRFRYVAVDGFDMEALSETTFSEVDMREWYRAGDAGWDAGRPRVLRSSDVDLAAFSREAGGSEDPLRAGGLDRMRCTACLPVTYKGRVLAVLNLDNFTHEEAIASDSLRTLALFGPPVASLLAAAQHRDELVRASRTDPLTGLANRAGFLRLLERQHLRSAHSLEPYAVLVMDLTDFKQLNDALGHAAGDAALTAVAQALESASRPGDALGRWGGDEFVALLPNATGEDALLVAKRLRRAVAAIEVGSRRLGIDIGAAWFPEDGLVPESLLLEADARMYASKRSGKGLARAG